MAMTATAFRRIALGFQSAEERSHMNHPDFRINGRIFATLSADGRKGMVKLTPEQQAACLRAHAAMFEPASGAWGRQGATMVMLAEADEETLGEAITLAYQNEAGKPPTASRSKRAAAGPRSRRPALPRKARK
jgi:hypothetical protein